MSTTQTTELHVFRCLSDNTGALLRDAQSGRVAAIDVPDAAAYAAELAKKGWTLTDILVTHEHSDHIQGIAELKAATGASVTGPAEARAGAPVDRVIGEGDQIAFGATTFDVWHTPGHCAGHLSLISRGAGLAFVGDVIFVMGCGRVLQGQSAEVLWRSIERFAQLPDDTILVTGHDYTLSNARFALSMEPSNAALVARAAEAEAAKTAGRFWSTTTLGEERATNPFLRAGEPSLAAAVGRVGAPAEAVFTALREAKNKF